MVVEYVLKIEYMYVLKMDICLNSQLYDMLLSKPNYLWA